MRGNKVTPHEQALKPGRVVAFGEVIIVQYRLGTAQSYAVYKEGDRLPLFTQSGGSATLVKQGESMLVTDGSGHRRIANLNGEPVVVAK